MLRLGVEKDIEVVRQAALLLEAENQKLVQKILVLQRELLQLKGGDPTQLALKLAELEQQLAQRNQTLFGDSSERRAKTKRSGAKPPQRGHGPKKQNLREVEQVIDLGPVAATVCEHCKKAVEEWPGQFEASDEIDVITREFVCKKIKRKKARCKCHRTIVTAPAPPKLFPSARYSIDFAILVVIAKYLDHLPLERQARIMKREGLDVDSQTLWDYVYAVARILRPAHDQLRDYLLDKAVVGVDETWWRLMGAEGKRAGGDGKRWQVWSLCGNDAVYYQLEDTRGLSAAEKLLKNYRGVVMADGYGVYSALAKKGGGFELAHCWSHVRRKFLEAEEAFPEEAAFATERIDALFHIDGLCPTGPPGDAMRAKLRAERSRPVVDEINRWVFTVTALPRSSLRKAIDYMLGLWKGLTRFLDDARIPLSNNHTERSLRGPVVGRKNHYGSRSRRGTEAAAILYSFVESAKLADVDPHAYLRVAILAALAGERIPLPHELVTTTAMPSP
ncbi:MAG: IS66 family transposase [Polyangiaceae bacterium]|nr:IS66 family transposase [Polyangiaceae bacterium]